MSRSLHLIQPRRAAQSAAIFDKIAVIGLGAVGGSVALAARETWPEALVIGVDDNDILEQAMLRHAVDVASHDLAILGDAGLVVLARSETVNLELLRALPDHLAGPAVVTDTGTTKQAICAAAQSLPRRLTFVAGHPVVGALDGGLTSARPDLFDGCRWVLTPPDPPNDEAFDRLWAIASGLGASPVSMTAADHDRLFGLLLHLPGLALAGLLSIVAGNVAADDLKWPGPLLAEVERLVPGPPERWQAICRTNAQELRTAVDALIGLLRDCQAHLDDEGWLRQFFEHAAALRQTASLP